MLVKLVLRLDCGNCWMVRSAGVGLELHGMSDECCVLLTYGVIDFKRDGTLITCNQLICRC